MITNYANFRDAIDRQIKDLKSYGAPVDPGRWQGVPTEGKPDLVTVELMDVAFRVHMHRTVDKYGDDYAPDGVLWKLRDEIQPNLPWADDHFAERVSRVPSNPGEAYRSWPWWHGQDDSAMETFHMGPGKTEPQVAQVYEKKFSHTYQERFWPKMAGRPQGSFEYTDAGNEGIRYTYGDLDDVVNMLVKGPYTRQAYLPIFFPEDTGAVHGGRIPCTLGYHFLLRNDQLHLWYDIRSCDAVRHFRDDVYLACRLALWVLEECAKRMEVQGIADRSETSTLPRAGTPKFLWHTVRPGILTFHAHSFHVHKGDLHLL